MVLAYVFIKGWIIDPYEQCFFYQSTEVVVFPPHYVEIFYGDMVTSGVKMVIYRGGCLEVFFEPLSQIFLRTLQCVPHRIPPCHTCTYK